jgi:hypothetical protein
MFARMPFLLDQAWRFGIYASIIWPALILWVGLALVALASWKQRRGGISGFPVLQFAGWLLLLTALPMAMLLIGFVGWEAASSAPHSHPLVIAMYALALLQVAGAYSLVWSLRTHRAIALCTSIIGIVWGLGAFFISGFALAGTWP